jgi:uncharacterized FlaG/YvyC family protein
MPYKIAREGNDYKIVESETGQVVRRTPSRKDAKMMCRSLNMGSGFDGFTPDFFTQTYKKSDP